MWITNDVALITFIPFTVMTLTMIGLEKSAFCVSGTELADAFDGDTGNMLGNYFFLS